MKPKILYIGFRGDNPTTIGRDWSNDNEAAYVLFSEIVKYLPHNVRNELLGLREDPIGAIIDTPFGKAKVVKSPFYLEDPCCDCIFKDSDCNPVICTMEDRVDQTDVYYKKVD